MNPQDRALLQLGRWLEADGYRFTTVTPATHARVIARADEARSVRDVFGWSLPFRRELLAPEWVKALVHAGALERAGDRCRSKVRFSTTNDGLYAHSAYPTTEADAVFFGPDTYRFLAFAKRALGAVRPKRLVDVGCGTGACGLELAADVVTLTDVSSRALSFARINAALAGRACELVSSDVLARVEGPCDAIVANPPYMRDTRARAYRDGGGTFGEALALRILREALLRLEPGGVLALYTGAAIVSGRDVFRERAADFLAGHAYRYEELDVDVFGESLDEPAYADVERIAAVGLVVRT